MTITYYHLLLWSLECSACERCGCAGQCWAWWQHKPRQNLRRWSQTESHSPSAGGHREKKHNRTTPGCDVCDADFHSHTFLTTIWIIYHTKVGAVFQFSVCSKLQMSLKAVLRGSLWFRRKFQSVPYCSFDLIKTLRWDRKLNVGVHHGCRDTGSDSSHINACHMGLQALHASCLWRFPAVSEWREPPLAVERPPGRVSRPRRCEVPRR